MPRPKTPASEYKQLTLRLPPAIIDALKQEAEAARRSINTQALVIFEERYLPTQQLGVKRAARKRRTD